MNDEKKLEIKRLKKYIWGRVEKREDDYIQKLNGNIKEIIYSVVDFDEEFTSYVNENRLNYSNDDEIEFIQDKIDLDYVFIELLLWFKYCFEMEKGNWAYDEAVCLNCNSGPLIFKEVKATDFMDKIVCQNCSYEMINGEKGLEKFDLQTTRV